MPNFFMPFTPWGGSAPNWAAANLTVQTTSQTTFTNFTTDSIDGVAANDIVSVGGWMFSTPSSTPPVTVAASQVMLRPGPMPLF
jgi:hypothetical protein